MHQELRRQRIKGLVEAGGVADEMMPSDCPYGAMRRKVQRWFARACLALGLAALLCWLMRD